MANEVFQFGTLCLNSGHRKEWWREAVKGGVHNIYFCEVQTASWEDISKIEGSRNKNKMWCVVPAVEIQK